MTRMTRLGAPRKVEAEQVYEALCSFVEDLGYPPTIQELREALGVGSTRTIQRYLEDLEARGWIVRWHGSRGMKLVREGDPAELDLWRLRAKWRKDDSDEDIAYMREFIKGLRTLRKGGKK